MILYIMGINKGNDFVIHCYNETDNCCYDHIKYGFTASDYNTNIKTCINFVTEHILTDDKSCKLIMAYVENSEIINADPLIDVITVDIKHCIELHNIKELLLKSYTNIV